MAKRDYYKYSDSPYNDCNRDKMLELLEKKDELLSCYQIEIQKLRKRIDEKDVLEKQHNDLLKLNKELEDSNKILEGDLASAREEIAALKYLIDNSHYQNQ